MQSGFVPFLLSLEADGITLTVRDYERLSLVLSAEGHWDLMRLRCAISALYSRERGHREAIFRRFDQFFNTKTGLTLRKLDLLRLRKELDAYLSPRSSPRPDPKRTVRFLSTEPSKGRTGKSGSPPFGRFLSAILLLLLLFTLPEKNQVRNATPPIASETTTVQKEKASEIQESNPPVNEIVGQTPKKIRQRLYSGVPKVSMSQSDPSPPSILPFLSMTLLFIMALVYLTWLWFSRRPPRDLPLDWREDRERHFPAEQIGGKAAPRLTRARLDHLADSLGYFCTEQAGRKLDVAASIDATNDRGGIPELVFEYRKQVRGVIILEDKLCESLQWNSLPGELAEGLGRRGVPVIHAGFYGSLSQFTDAAGTTLYLEDLDAGRTGFIVLIFSDAKFLHNRRHALEDLSLWPMTAWFEPRAREQWDSQSTIPTRNGIPLYTATPEGVSSALSCFASERGLHRDENRHAPSWRGAPLRGEKDLAAYLEELLGDTLPWTQACAMVQPIGFGLADRLRAHFHPEISPDRINLLTIIPGVSRNVTGLRFNAGTLAVLRAGFATRRTESEQEAVLRFILAEIDRVEPQDRQSPAHLSWMWIRERVHLELAPDKALEKLVRLSKSPLSARIRTELSSIALPGNDIQKGVALRKAPKHTRSKQRLALLTGKPLQVMPLTIQQRLIAATLVLAFLISLLLNLNQEQKNGDPYAFNLNAQTDAHIYFTFENRINPGQINSVFFARDQLEMRIPQSFRYIAFGDGHSDWIDGEQQAGTLEISINTEDLIKPCREDIPELGLTILRCGPSDIVGEDYFQTKSWRDAVGPEPGYGFQYSLALVFADDDHVLASRYIHHLWKGNAIDMLVLYKGTLTPGGAEKWLPRVLPNYLHKYTRLILISGENRKPGEDISHMSSATLNFPGILRPQQNNDTEFDDLTLLGLQIFPATYREELISEYHRELEKLVTAGKLDQAQAFINKLQQLMIDTKPFRKRLNEALREENTPAQPEPNEDTAATDINSSEAKPREATIAQPSEINSTDTDLDEANILERSGEITKMPIARTSVEDHANQNPSTSEKEPFIDQVEIRFSKARANHDLIGMREAFGEYEKRKPNDSKLKDWRKKIDGVQARHSFQEALAAADLPRAGDMMEHWRSLETVPPDEIGRLQTARDILDRLDRRLDPYKKDAASLWEIALYFDPNREKSKYLHTLYRCAQSGHIPAKIRYALHLLERDNSSRRSQVIIWLNEAWKGDMDHPQKARIAYFLGMAYSEGGVLEKSEARAQSLLITAARLEDHDAQANLRIKGIRW